MSKTSYLLEKKTGNTSDEAVRQRIAAAENRLVEEYSTRPEVLRMKDGSGIFVQAHRRDWDEYRTATGASLSQLLRKIESDQDFLVITAFRSTDKTEDESAHTPRTMKQNVQQFRALPKELRSLLGTEKIGAYWLVGHWTNCSVPLGTRPISECSALGGELVDSLEYSWFFVIHQRSVSSQALLEAAVKIAKDHDQEAFVIRLEGETTLRNQDGSIGRPLTSNGAIEQAWATLAQKREGAKAYGYTELRNVRERWRRQPIAFPDAPATEQAGEPHSTSKTSAYRVRGNGQAYEPAFFVAKPHNNSSSMIFASMGIEFLI